MTFHVSLSLAKVTFQGFLPNCVQQMVSVKRTHTESYRTQCPYLHVSCTLRDVLVCTYMPTMYCLLCTLVCKDALLVKVWFTSVRLNFFPCNVI